MSTVRILNAIGTYQGVGHVAVQVLLAPELRVQLEELLLILLLVDLGNVLVLLHVGLIRNYNIRVRIFYNFVLSNLYQPPSYQAGRESLFSVDGAPIVFPTARVMESYLRWPKMWCTV